MTVLKLREALFNEGSPDLSLVNGAESVQVGNSGPVQQSRLPFGDAVGESKIQRPEHVLMLRVGMAVNRADCGKSTTIYEEGHHRFVETHDAVHLTEGQRR